MSVYDAESLFGTTFLILICFTLLFEGNEDGLLAGKTHFN